MTRRPWLEEAIAQRGLTRERLAELLGVTVGAVSHWINGRTVPGAPARKLLALYLLVDEDIINRGFEDGVAEEPEAIEGAA